jgi:autotransporter family porin
MTSAASYTTSASAAPTTAARGTTLTIDVVAKSDTAQSLLVDLEVYRPDGQKVLQPSWDNQSFSAGQQRTFRATWAVPADAALGTYSIKIGLFSPGWGTLYHWNDAAGQFSVAAAGSGAGSGTGLTGQYYDNKDLTNLKLTRTDATINFDWASGAPSSAVGGDTFSVRWQGQVQPRFSETYTFYTTSDDGVQLWINGQQVVNNWTNHSATDNSGAIALTAGQKYNLKLEYYDNTAAAVIKLAWSSPSQPRQIIPQSQLYPSTPSTPTPTPIPTRTPTPTAQPTATPVTPTPTAGTGRYFTTLPPGAQLPSDAECAAAVKRRPENKGVNASYNATRGNQRLASDFIGGDPRANSQIAARVSGNFTGTTDEILQWTACKWGIDEDMVRAQAAIESWWRQTTKGDWSTDASRCPPGHGLGTDGQAGQCPESWGILQNRYPYEQSAWPGIANSTAFNADTAYAIWRACYEGYEWWLNDVEHGQTYAAGDAWGCIGRWFAGRWHTQPAEDYISRVRGYLADRVWEQPSFQEP